MTRDAGSVTREAWGFTLVEVIVVLALVGLTVGMAGLALASLKPTREAETLAELRRARAEAIRTGRPARAADGQLFLPDGSSRGPGVAVLTGERHEVR